MLERGVTSGIAAVSLTLLGADISMAAKPLQAGSPRAGRLRRRARRDNPAAKAQGGSFARRRRNARLGGTERPRRSGARGLDGGQGDPMSDAATNASSDQ